MATPGEAGIAAGLCRARALCIAALHATVRPATPSFWAETGPHLGVRVAWGQANYTKWLASGEAERNCLLEGLLQVPTGTAGDDLAPLVEEIRSDGLANHGSSRCD